MKFLSHLSICGYICTLGLVITPAMGKNAEPAKINTYPAYVLLERLLESPQQIMVHQFSSHNKHGLNGDENWPLYRDDNGDDVIFDAVGPGCIRSMWGTNFEPDAILKFYFNGEKDPRYKINQIDFYKGKHPDFPPPLVSYEKRGMWGDRPFAGNSFVPIPFEKSLIIAVEGKSRFFHIIYEQYPYKTPTSTFSGNENHSALLDCFKRNGEAPIRSEGLKVINTSQKNIAPGQTLTLLKLEDTSGIIRKIIIEADGSVDFFQNSHIRMKWDKHLRWDVLAPIGIFFGSAVKADNMRSLPLRVEKLETGRVRLSCYFPMPFWDSAEIEWQNKSLHQMAPLEAKIYISTNSIEPKKGNYFTTLYHEGQTIYGHDWLLFEGLGTGWFAGVVQSMQMEHYCEGDEHFYLDGVISPQLNGTGSEDYYLACFWPDIDFDMPFGCVVGDVYKEGGGHQLGSYHIPSCYSRYHLEAPIPFYSSINARIQHGGLSHILSNYRSLAFCYINKRPSMLQTDFIDVGNPASEKAHGYQTSHSSPVTAVIAYPEGEYFEVGFDDKGRYHSKGEIEFVVSIDADNDGVRLRRRIDQKFPRQTAHVYIDGEYAGCWRHGYQNENLRWFDSDFDIHPEYTKGKNSLSVKLEIVASGEKDQFTDFRYDVFSYR